MTWEVGWVPGLSRVIDPCSILQGCSFISARSPSSTGSAERSARCPSGTEAPWRGVALLWLDINLAQHVILRKLVGGETEKGSFIEVVVSWEIIYRISGKLRVQLLNGWSFS